MLDKQVKGDQEGRDPAYVSQKQQENKAQEIRKNDQKNDPCKTKYSELNFIIGVQISGPNIPAF
jgi:hypothetical protein